MEKHIAIIQANPDASVRHYEHALADEYAKGCEDGGHEVKRIEVAQLDFPLLRRFGRPSCHSLSPVARRHFSLLIGSARYGTSLTAYPFHPSLAWREKGSEQARREHFDFVLLNHPLQKVLVRCA